MNKIFVSGILTTLLFAAGIASLPAQAMAQTYSPYTYGTYSSGLPGQGACVNITRDLSYGMRGSDVSSLQSFLVSQNFPGGGSWMVTGYFGNATLQAVRNFQSQQGIPMTGVADASTRAAISRVGCLPGQGGLSYYQNYSGAYPYVSYPSTYNYNFNNAYTYPYASGQLALTSMSQNTGGPGTSVTLYGVGFDPVGNTVYFGTQALPAVASMNGTSLTFTVPAYYQTYSYSSNQTVQVYVTNSRGSSNSLAFTFNTYQYYGCNQYGYNYGLIGSGSCYQPYQPPVNLQSPVATYLNPAQGGPGTSVTIVGSGFSSEGNTVHFGNGIIANLRSVDGTSLSFTVPATITGFGSQVLILGSYPISFTNSQGYTSNTLPFIVTSVAPLGASPTIKTVSGPTSLQTGAQGIWTITVNNPGYTNLTTSVSWGDSGVYGYVAPQPQIVVAQGIQTLTFTHTYYAAGTYTVVFTVTNPSGQSHSSSATVSVSGSNTNSVTISSLAPSSGPVGVQVTIYGTGFALGNTILFGTGAITNAYSPNGTSLVFTVPAYLTPYCAPNMYCAQYAQQVTPGQYNISVQNQNGTSNTLSFQVI